MPYGHHSHHRSRKGGIFSGTPPQIYPHAPPPQNKNPRRAFRPAGVLSIQIVISQSLRTSNSLLSLLSTSAVPSAFTMTRSSTRTPNFPGR